MELARMNSKGQLTIPVAIRRRLGVETGDQLLFYEKDGRIVIAAADPAALRDAQLAAAENHVYTIEELRRIAEPIAKAHGVTAMRLFGSYARGEATCRSDIDIVIDRGEVTSLLRLGSLQSALTDAFGKRVDLLADDSLEPAFRSAIREDEVLLYDRNA